MADGKVKLTDVRLSYPRLFEPKEYQEGDGRPRFDASFLIPEGSALDKQIQAKITELAAEVLGKKAGEIEKWRTNSNKFCYVKGDADKPGQEGMMVLSSHRSKKDGKPGVYDKHKDAAGNLIQLREDDGKPYAGCYVNATVGLYVQGLDTQNPGVRCSLTAVQFWRDGDSFGGAETPKASDFDAADGADDSDGMM